MIYDWLNTSPQLTNNKFQVKPITLLMAENIEPIARFWSRIWSDPRKPTSKLSPKFNFRLKDEFNNINKGKYILSLCIFQCIELS